VSECWRQSHPSDASTDTAGAITAVLFFNAYVFVGRAYLIEGDRLLGDRTAAS
jgi:hypothetical protein